MTRMDSCVMGPYSELIYTVTHLGQPTMNRLPFNDFLISSFS